MPNSEYSDDTKELALYVNFKIKPSKVRWKILTLPENNNSDRSSVPGPTFFESLMIVIDASPEDIKKIRSESINLTTANSISIPSEFIKSWLPPEVVKKLASKSIDKSFYTINNIVSTKTKGLDSFAVVSDSQITIYINYRNS